MVHALKYQGWRTLAEDMADLMTPWLPAHPRDQMVVPVPTTSWRSRMRGYNQAALLGEAVALREAIPLESALVRSGGRTQVHLGPRERSSNVQRAFRLRDEFRSRIRHRRVILVDDVLTTGATAISAARCLEEAGVASVHLLTFARSLPFTGKVAR
jgi:ComF family protein